MKQLHIVLGLNWGDEGKGHVTNQLVLENNKSREVCVMRFSGGNNSTHRVIQGGVTHDFSSFGAGCLAGASSYIHKTCFYNPIAMMNEYNALSRHCRVRAAIHPLTELIIPLDVMKQANWDIGQSTGVGLYYAVDRSLRGKSIKAMDLLVPDVLEKKLLGLSSEENHGNFDLDDINNAWLAAAKDLSHTVEIQDESFLDNFMVVIAEGSQGILLDQTHGLLPETATTSNTTSENLIDIAKGFPWVQKHYVTRTYATRHGDGYFPHHLLKYRDKSKLPKILKNDANQNNKFQGEFKVGQLDINTMKYALLIDKLYGVGASNTNCLEFTCVDHTKNYCETTMGLQSIDTVFGHLKPFVDSVRQHKL
jgi:adenylosuccinate synthase